MHLVVLPWAKATNSDSPYLWKASAHLHSMVFSALWVASPCPVCEFCESADEGELHHAVEADGGIGKPRAVNTLLWFSHSADEASVLAQIAEHCHAHCLGMKQYWDGK